MIQQVIDAYLKYVIVHRYTCEECVQGLEWVEAYLEDPIMSAEFVVYLQQNFCTNDMRHCHENVANHFPAMHAMAMEKFFIPTEVTR